LDCSMEDKGALEDDINETINCQRGRPNAPHS